MQQVSSQTLAESPIRPVGLSRPQPLDDGPPRPLMQIRAQSADERPLPAGPPLTGLEKPPLPRPVPISMEPRVAIGESTFTPPAPKLLGTPSTAPITSSPITSSPIVSSPMTSSSPLTVWGGAGPIMTPDLLGLNDGGLGAGPLLDGCGTPGDLCCDGACPTGCFAGNGCCLPRSRFWVGADYLLWYTKAMSVPPLVTASPVGTPVGQSGVLAPGNPTVVLLDSIDNQVRSGVRVYGGFWFSDCCNWGLDSSAWFLGRRSTNDTFGPGGQISRPFTNSNGTPNSELVSFIGTNPGGFNFSGTVSVQTYSYLSSFDVNLREKLCCGPTYWVDALYGYRHFQLGEGLSITENLAVLGQPNGTPFIGTNTVRDEFRTRNRFDGGQVGLAGEYRFAPRWSLFGSAKVALGNMHETVDIRGAQTFTPAAGGTTTTVPGGLLALNSNIGHYTLDRFAVVPELTMKVGLDVTNNLRLYVGYDFFYTSSVVRPGDQIDTVVNTNRIPFAPLGLPGGTTGPARPAVLFKTTDFFAQGVNFGLMYHW